MADDYASDLARERLFRPALRWLVLVLVLGVAFHGTWAALRLELAAGTEIGYIYLVPILALVAFIGVTAHASPGPPINDRQTDIIVGSVVLILAIGFEVMLVPRFTAVYLTLHLDLLAVWLFALGSSVLLFGTRPTARYRWVWLILLGAFPLPNRMLVIAAGGSQVVIGLIYVGFGMLAAAVATGRTRLLALLGAAAAGVAGVLAVAALAIAFPDADRWIYVLLPASVGAVVGAGALYVDQRRRHAQWRPLARTVRIPTVASAAKAAVGVGAVAVLLAVIAPPTDSSIDLGTGVAVPPGRTVPVAGWTAIDEKRVDWVRQYYGPGASLTRQTWRQDHGELRWDPLQRPRSIVVDALLTLRPVTLSVYPLLLLYEANGSRFSAPAAVSLAHGVDGEFTNIVDDRTRVSYTRLSWRWHVGDAVEAMSLIAVDDHRESAVFPLTRPTAAQKLGMLASVLLRGNLVITDFTGELKDDELLTEVANELIDTRMRVGAAA